MEKSVKPISENQVNFKPHMEPKTLKLTAHNVPSIVFRPSKVEHTTLTLKKS